MNLFWRLRELREVVLDFIAPPRRTDALVRSLTRDNLLAIRASFAKAQESDHTILLPYRQPFVSALIWEIKYYQHAYALHLGAELLAEEMLAFGEEEFSRPLLIPIPMHERRLHTRRLNQCQLLSEAIMARLPTAFEYAPGALARIRFTPPQQGLPRAERLTNVAYSMEAGPEVLGRICIVLDDVTTTGATFKEAFRALKEAGARQIYCVALAG